MEKYQRNNGQMEMVEQKPLELSHKVRDRVRLMQWDIIKCELKHHQDMKQEDFKVGLLSSWTSNLE